MTLAEAEYVFQLYAALAFLGAFIGGIWTGLH